MEYKKVDVELLEKLQKATEEYKAMAGALIGESKETMGEEVFIVYWLVEMIMKWKCFDL